MILLLSLISFLFLSADEHRVIYIRHSCAALRYTVRNTESSGKQQLEAGGGFQVLTSPRAGAGFSLWSTQGQCQLPRCLPVHL